MSKIMMVAPFESNGRYKGGIASIVNNLCDMVDFNEYNSQIIKFNTCRINRDKSTEASFSIENIKNMFLIYKDLVAEVKKNKPDVIYYHTSVRFALLKDLLIIKMLKNKFDIPVAIHIHFADYDKIVTKNKFLDFFIVNFMKKTIDHIVFLSEKTKKQFIDKGIDESKCSVVYNFSTLNFSENEVGSKLKKEKVEFLFVGTIDERKGIFDVLDVLNGIEKEFVIHICGQCQDKKLQEQFEQCQASALAT